MKQEWSRNWASSVQPRKQRKYVANAPLHVRQKLVSVHLSRELRERYGKRSLPVRKGDSVRVMKGSFKGVAGTVERVDLSKLKVYVDEVKRKKVDGSEVHVPLSPSNLIITKAVLDDKRRQAIIERSAGSGKIGKKEKKGGEEAKKTAKEKPARKEKSGNSESSAEIKKKAKKTDKSKKGE